MDINDLLVLANVEPSDYQGTLAVWRNVSKEIHTYSDDVVRDLFIRFSEYSSSLQWVIGSLSVNVSRRKWDAENKMNYLLAVVYDNGPVNQRTIEAKSNSEYSRLTGEVVEAEAMLVLAKSLVSACDVAANALSRELSYRIKTN